MQFLKVKYEGRKGLELIWALLFLLSLFSSSATVENSLNDIRLPGNLKRIITHEGKYVVGENGDWVKDVSYKSSDQLLEFRDFIRKGSSGELKEVILDEGRFIWGDDGTLLQFPDDKELETIGMATASDSEIYFDLENEESEQTEAFTILPPVLDFGSTPLCQPMVKEFSITNDNPIDDLIVYSVTSESPYFHIGPIRNNIIAPKASITVSVVFLPRNVELLTQKIIVTGSSGQFRYPVTGKGTENMFGLKSLFEARVPAGIPYTTTIEIRNPLKHPLQINEIYSSGGDLSLSIPKTKAPSSTVWTILPGETKSVVSLEVNRRLKGAYHGYVYINSDDPKFGSQIVDVEMFVLERGVFMVPRKLDFGFVTGSREKSLPVVLYNAGVLTGFEISAASLELKSKNLERRPNAVALQFKKSIIPSKNLQTIGTLMLSAKGLPSGLYEGNVVVKTNDTTGLYSVLKLPFSANVLHGTLSFANADIRIPLDSACEERSISVNNKFSEPLFVYDLGLGDKVDAHFDVTNKFEGVIPAKSSVSLLSLKGKSRELNETFKSIVHVRTNITTYAIPIYVFNGRLNVYAHDRTPVLSDVGREEVCSLKLENAMKDDSMEQDVVDFGIIGRGEKRHMFATIANLNPVDVEVFSIESSVGEAQASIFCKFRESDNDVVDADNVNTKSGVIESRSSLGLKISVLGNNVGEQSAVIRGKYSYGEFVLNVKYVVMNGTLSLGPSPVIFDKVFPGNHHQVDIIASSSFSSAVTVFSATGEEPRLEVIGLENAKEVNEKPIHLFSVALNPMLGEESLNYLEEGMSMQQSNSFFFEDTVSDSDLSMFELSRSKFAHIQKAGKDSVNSVVHVYTSVTHYELPVKAQWVFPNIVKNMGYYSLEFIERSPRDVEILIDNPSDEYIFVSTAVEAPERVYSSILAYHRQQLDENGMGHVKESSLAQKTPLKVDLDLSFVLKPREVVKKNISITPLAPGDFDVVVFLKNNLTVFDPVFISGKVGKGRVSLLADEEFIDFALDETDTSLCAENQMSESDFKSLSFSKSVQLKNTGNVDMLVAGVGVGNSMCSGHSFTVNNCEKFVWKAGYPWTLNLTFHPDFFVSRVEESITFKTAGGDISIPIRGSIPAEDLPKCSAAKPREFWENILALLVVNSVCVVGTYLLFKALCDFEFIASKLKKHTARVDWKEGDQDQMMEQVCESRGSTGSDSAVECYEDENEGAKGDVLGADELRDVVEKILAVEAKAEYGRPVKRPDEEADIMDIKEPELETGVKDEEADGFLKVQSKHSRSLSAPTSPSSQRRPKSPNRPGLLGKSPKNSRKENSREPQGVTKTHSNGNAKANVESGKPLKQRNRDNGEVKPAQKPKKSDTVRSSRSISGSYEKLDKSEKKVESKFQKNAPKDNEKNPKQRVGQFQRSVRENVHGGRTPATDGGGRNPPAGLSHPTAATKNVHQRKRNTKDQDSAEQQERSKYATGSRNSGMGQRNEVLSNEANESSLFSSFFPYQFQLDSDYGASSSKPPNGRPRSPIPSADISSRKEKPVLYDPSDEPPEAFLPFGGVREEQSSSMFSQLQFAHNIFGDNADFEDQRRRSHFGSYNLFSEQLEPTSNNRSANDLPFWDSPLFSSQHPLLSLHNESERQQGSLGELETGPHDQTNAPEKKSEKSFLFARTGSGNPF
eukprot:Nk52_evm18s343 gene=Nk52_evmTU18s343